MKRFYKIFLLLFIFHFLLFTSVFAQQTYSTKSKKAIKYYEEGMPNVKLRKFDYARQLLEKAISSDDKFIEAHIALSYVYSDMNQPSKAIEEIKKAIEINPDFFPANYFTLARLQEGLGKYKEAKENLEKYLNSSPQNPAMKKMAQKDIANCDFAADAMLHPVPFKPINLGDGINSKYDEYFPAITADESLFLFTRKLPTDKNRDGFQEDFYVSEKENGKWNKAHSIGTQINTDANEGAPCLSADGRILFFVVSEESFDNESGHDYGLGRKGYGSCDIFYSTKTGNGWSKPQNVGPGVNTRDWETQPSFSSDGKTLYFIRGKIKEHQIQNPEIYMSVLNDSGQFRKAVRLSDVINTPGNEESVFIHPDNQTLYFSSDGHPGMGGLDIFVSRRQPNGEWGEPVNLGYPINTCNDENSFFVSRDGKTAYLASDRDGGCGGLDMYKFDLYEAARPGKTTYTKGKVFDAITKQPLEADIEVMDLKMNQPVIKWKSDNHTGEFLICLPMNHDYAFNVSKDSYLFRSENFSFSENKEYEPIAINIPLSPIEKDSSVILKNVFFETNKFNLKDESKSELNKLVDFLNKNKTLKIELSGHTDNVGDKKLNQLLSENRAKSVLEYLVANGIAKERLTYKGYGDTKPVVANDSDEHRQMNRRTEFKVISK